MQGPEAAVATADPEAIGWFSAVVLGLVEGITEFLPVSSTGHLIVANAMLGGSNPAFEVAIQMGAITAIAVLYRQRLIDAGRGLLAARAAGASRINLFVLLVCAALPAAVLGLAFEDQIEEVLFSPTTVGIALVVGGIALLGLERWLARRPAAAEPGSIESMTLGQAFGIGLFQCLALVPGTSRSGATIAGGLVLGMGRVAAAEFSFLVGLPVLYGACFLKLAKEPEVFFGPLLVDFLIGTVVSFVTAYLVVGPFVRFLQSHTFVVFGWYRIAAGGALLGAIAAGWL